MVSARTKYSYTIGCIGRDMVYTLVNTFLIFFITNGLGISGWEGVVVGFIMMAARFWDAVNDPIMGTLVDNTRTRFGKFKPWIITGALTNVIFTYLLFADFRLTGVPFLLVFTLIYIAWDITFTMNDIPYWSLLPSLTVKQSEREKIGSLARIFANVGLFVTTAGVPIFYSMGAGKEFYVFVFGLMAVVISIFFVLCQCLVIFGVKEQKNLITAQQEKMSFRQAFKTILKNDQLLVMVVTMLLFNIGYFTTTSFGTYFFEYEMRNGSMFTIFAIIIGVSQIVALLIFPRISARISRKKLYTISIILVIVGYLGFMAAGYVLGKYTMNIVYLSIIGFLLFFGQAFIQILVLMMLADTIEYGQWKNGTRNESIQFALQPFVNKMGSAFQAPLTMLTFAISGMDILNRSFSEIAPGLSGDALQEAKNAILDNTGNLGGMLLIMRLSMIIIPLILILLSYFLYMRKYKIDKPFYDKIIADLNERAQTEGVYIDGKLVAAEEISGTSAD